VQETFCLQTGTATNTARKRVRHIQAKLCSGTRSLSSTDRNFQNKSGLQEQQNSVLQLNNHMYVMQHSMPLNGRGLKIDAAEEEFSSGVPQLSYSLAAVSVGLMLLMLLLAATCVGVYVKGMYLRLV
jgi:hypothetical protein